MLDPTVVPSPQVPSAPKRRTRVLARRAAFVLVIAAVFTGCTSNGGPKDYNADVELNFTKACEEANPTNKVVTDVTQFCGCVYSELKNEFTFDEFKALDSGIDEAVGNKDSPAQTADDIAKLNSRYVEIVTGCEKSGPSVPASSTATTTTVNN